MLKPKIPWRTQDEEAAKPAMISPHADDDAVELLLTFFWSTDTAEVRDALFECAERDGAETDDLA